MVADSAIVYRIDSRDNIKFVNDEYNRFALENEGARFIREKVLDHPIWEYISDATTREIYAELLRRVRKGRTARFRLRCDSPAVRRLFEMEIASIAGEEIEFRTWPLSLEPRPPQPLLDPAIPRSNEMLVMCGWCKRVQIDGGWEEIEEAVSHLKLFDTSHPPMLTHGICDQCSEDMLRSMLSG